MDAVTLQITLAPFDVRHARHTLAHHARVWGPQVEEMLLVLDTRESRFRARKERGDAAEALEELRAVIDRLEHPHLRVVEVDYSAAARRETAARFDARPLPLSDFRGRPYYTYLFGLAQAAHPRVLHLDSDMLFGGGSPTWTAEADQWFAADETVVACNPLPGPPWRDGELKGQEGYPFTQAGPYAYRFANLSTRVFLADLARMTGRLRSLGGRHIPTLRSVVGSTLRGQVNWMPLEERLSAAIAESGSARLDFLGEGRGMWFLHPLERDEAFHRALPGLIAHLERGGDFPETQRGHYDLQASTLPALALPA